MNEAGSALAAVAWPLAMIVSGFFGAVVVLMLVATRRNPAAMVRLLQIGLEAQSIARLIVLIMSIPLIGVLGVASEINRTAAIAALAGIAGAAFGSAIGVRNRDGPVPPQEGKSE